MGSVNHKELKEEIENLKEKLVKYQLMEETYSEVEKLSKIGYWSWSYHEKKLSWSAEIYRIFGVSPADFEVTEDNFEKLIHPDDLEYLLAEREKAFKSGKIANFTHRIVRPGGEIRIVTVKSKIIFKNDIPVKVLGTIQDITSLKIAEQLIEEKSRRCNETERMAKLGHWELNIKNNVLKWSDEIYRICEIEPNSIEPTYDTFLSYVHPDEREMVNDAYKESVKNKTPFDIVHRIVLENNIIKYVNEKCTTYYNSEGEAVRSFGMTWDITEKVKTEQEIKQSEEKFSFAFKYAPYPKVITRLSNGTLIEVNDMFLKHFECSLSDVINKTTLDLKSWKNNKERNRFIEKLIKDGQITNYETILEDIKGEKITCLLSASVITINNEKCVLNTIIDISERKKVEQEIKDALHFQHILMNNISTGVVIIDKETLTIENINQAASVILGYDYTDLVGNRCQKIFCPKKFETCYMRNSAEGYENVEDIFIRRNGSEFPVLKTVKRINIKNREKHLLTFLDIGHYKEIQQALKENEALLSLFIKHSPIFAYIKNVNPNESIVRNASENFADMIGVKGKDMVGKNMYELFPAEFAKKITQDDWEVASKGKNLKQEEELNNRNYITYKFPIKQGNRVLLAGYTIDITESKLAAKALKESEERWKFALEGAGDGLWDWDLTTNKAFFSNHWKTMLGYEENEIFDQIDEWLKRVHQDDIGQCQSELKSYLDKEVNFYSNIHRVLCKDGEYKWILARGKIIRYDENENPLRMIGTHADISTQIKMEKQLAQMNADKDRFISLLAHDLKNPFSAFLGLTEMLLNEYKNIEHEQLEKILGLLHSTANRTYNLLNDLLMWSKSQSGKMQLKSEKVVFHEICEDIINLLSNSAKAKEISIDCSEQKPIVMSADSNMLRTVLRNLTSNAIKFTNPRGKINLNAEEYEGKALITVADNGVGIKDEDINKLWDFTVSHVTIGTNNERGTGFGLIVCKEFIEKHGGEIWAESVLGKGSKFKFTMPLYNK